MCLSVVDVGEFVAAAETQGATAGRRGHVSDASRVEGRVSKLDSGRPRSPPTDRRPVLFAARVMFYCVRIDFILPYCR